MKRWYMRENHTFLPLSTDNKEALAAVLKDFDAGHTHGMLCAKSFPQTVHAGSKDTREDFRRNATSWLAETAKCGESK